MHKNLIGLGLACSMLFVTSSTFAKYSDEFVGCMKAAKNQKQEIHECQLDEYKAQEKLLKKTYNTLLDAKNAEESALLEQDQAKWLAVRERSCKIKDKKANDMNLPQLNCSLTMTASRVDGLQVRLNNKNVN